MATSRAPLSSSQQQTQQQQQPKNYYDDPFTQEYYDETEEYIVEYSEYTETEYTEEEVIEEEVIEEELEEEEVTVTESDVNHDHPSSSPYHPPRAVLPQGQPPPPPPPVPAPPHDSHTRIVANRAPLRQDQRDLRDSTVHRSNAHRAGGLIAASTTTTTPRRQQHLQHQDIRTGMGQQKRSQVVGQHRPGNGQNRAAATSKTRSTAATMDAAAGTRKVGHFDDGDNGSYRKATTTTILPMNRKTSSSGRRQDTVIASAGSSTSRNGVVPRSEKSASVRNAAESTNRLQNRHDQGRDSTGRQQEKGRESRGQHQQALRIQNGNGRSGADRRIEASGRIAETTNQKRQHSVDNGKIHMRSSIPPTATSRHDLRSHHVDRKVAVSSEERMASMNSAASANQRQPRRRKKGESTNTPAERPSTTNRIEVRRPTPRPTTDSAPPRQDYPVDRGDAQTTTTKSNSGRRSPKTSMNMIQEAPGSRLASMNTTSGNELQTRLNAGRQKQKTVHAENQGEESRLISTRTANKSQSRSKRTDAGSTSATPLANAENQRGHPLNRRHHEATIQKRRQAPTPTKSGRSDDANGRNAKWNDPRDGLAGMLAAAVSKRENRLINGGHEEMICPLPTPADDEDDVRGMAGSRATNGTKRNINTNTKLNSQGLGPGARGETHTLKGVDGDALEPNMELNEPPRSGMAAMIAAAAKKRQTRLDKGGEKKITHVEKQADEGLDMAGMIAKKANERSKRIEAGGELKVTEVQEIPEEHKVVYVDVALEAARIGILTRLHEYTVEAVAEKKEEKVWAGPSGLRTDHIRSSMFMAINEAAALGRMMGPKPVEVTSYDPNIRKVEKEDEDVDKMKDEHGRRVVRQLYLIDRQIEQDRKSKEEEWSAEKSQDIVRYNQWEDVELPSETAPKWQPRPSTKSHRDLMEAISNGVAERAWERNYRLNRPKANLKLTRKCNCRFCLNPNPFQTHKYKMIEEGKLEELKGPIESPVEEPTKIVTVQPIDEPIEETVDIEELVVELVGEDAPMEQATTSAHEAPQEDDTEQLALRNAPRTMPLPVSTKWKQQRSPVPKRRHVGMDYIDKKPSDSREDYIYKEPFRSRDDNIDTVTEPNWSHTTGIEPTVTVTVLLDETITWGHKRDKKGKKPSKKTMKTNKRGLRCAIM